MTAYYSTLEGTFGQVGVVIKKTQVGVNQTISIHRLQGMLRVGANVPIVPWWPSWTLDSSPSLSAVAGIVKKTSRLVSSVFLATGMVFTDIILAKFVTVWLQPESGAQVDLEPAGDTEGDTIPEANIRMR